MSSKQHVLTGFFVALTISASWYVLLIFADALGLPSGARTLNSVAVYFTTALWIFMAVGALSVCVLEERQDQKELERARGLKLYILIRTAYNNHEHAVLAVAQGVMKLLVGLAAGYLLYRIGPSPDYSPVQNILRVFFMLDIYYFWMAKRKTRARRRNVPKPPVDLAGNEVETVHIEQARDEVTAEIRENRRVFAEFGALVMNKLEAIERRLNG